MSACVVEASDLGPFPKRLIQVSSQAEGNQEKSTKAVKVNEIELILRFSFNYPRTWHVFFFQIRELIKQLH